jgi:hypothetical protein
MGSAQRREFQPPLYGPPPCCGHGTAASSAARATGLNTTTVVCRPMGRCLTARFFVTSVTHANTNGVGNGPDPTTAFNWAIVWPLDYGPTPAVLRVNGAGATSSTQSVPGSRAQL